MLCVDDRAVTSDSHDSRPVGRRWYFLVAAVLLFFASLLYGAARLDDLPLLAEIFVVFFALTAIKAHKIMSPTESVWGRVVGRDAALFATAILLMQASWHWLTWGDLDIVHIGLVELLSVLIVAPLIEEAVFRGLLFNALNCGQRRAAVFLQVFLCALFFAVWHLKYWGTWSLPLMLIAGVIFGIARHRSGGILLPVALHALMNVIAVCISLWR